MGLFPLRVLDLPHLAYPQRQSRNCGPANVPVEPWDVGRQAGRRMTT